MSVKKLLLHEKVEVRQVEDGLRGAWHPGVVIGVQELSRSVEYDELLSETGDSKLIECISVTEAIDGNRHRCHVSSTYRGHIRPLPPQSKSESGESKFTFGVCVDAFFEDAWWEGVLLDGDCESDERLIYFPDEGDERRFGVNDLRVSLVWDEYLDLWIERGAWVLVELAKGIECDDGQLSQFIKQVWDHLRSNYGFEKMVSEWTCSTESLWKKYFREAVEELATGTSLGGLNHNISACLPKKRGRKPKISEGTNSESCLNNSARFEELAIEASLGGLDHNISACLPKRRGRKSKISDGTNSKSCLNSSANGSKPIKLSPNKNKKISVERCKSKNQLVNIKNRSEKQRSLKVKKGTCNTEVADILQDQLKRKPSTSLTQCGASGKDQCDELSNSSHCRSREKLNTLLPTQVKQSLKKNTKGKKNQLVIARATEVVPGEKYNQPVNRRRNLTNLKKSTKNISVGGKGSGDAKASCVPIKQRHSSTSVTKITKIKKKSSSKVKAPPKEKLKVFEATETKDDMCTSSQQPMLHFSTYGSKVRLKDMVSPQKRKKRKHAIRKSDPVCIICQDVGELIRCDRCPTSFHVNCVSLQNVPDGIWFCPLCCCGLCGLRNANVDETRFTDVCYQCSRQYHLDCLTKVGETPLRKFCSKNCSELFQHLHQLLGVSHRTSVEGLTWKMIRSTKNDYESHNGSRIDTNIELSRAIEVMHECFQPVIEPHTKRDLIHDVIFNSVSKFRRLDFRGFYVMILQKGAELVCVATIRIHGQKVAEMPLIGTPFDYRRQGMCGLLVQELEKLLITFGVERLVLPAISQLSETWKSSFGFSEMLFPRSIECTGYPFLVFYGTKMFQKVLSQCKTVNEAKQDFRVSQENENRQDLDKHYGLRYNRKRKMENSGKENKVKPQIENGETLPTMQDSQTEESRDAVHNLLNLHGLKHYIESNLLQLFQESEGPCAYFFVDNKLINHKIVL